MCVTVHDQIECRGIHVEGHRRIGASSVVRLKASWALLSARCCGCGLVVFPSLSACPRCNTNHFLPTPLPSEGVLYTFSVVHSAPKGWKVPYIVGYADLSSDLRVFARVDLAEQALRIGMPLVLDVRPIDEPPTSFEYSFVANAAPHSEVLA
jgi:uncharacterized OB-fold protein